MGAGETWGCAAGVWWLSGGWWLSPLSPCACTGRESKNHVLRVFPVRDAGAVLVPAGIPAFSCRPLTPLSAAPTAKGLLCSTFPMEMFCFAWRVWGISVFRISQLFAFPGGFAHPERLSSGCSRALTETTLLRWPLLPPGAFVACPGAVPIPVPSPRLPPAAHTGSSVVETLFWSSRVHECKHCKSYSRKAGGFPGAFPSASFPAVTRLGTEQ